MERLREKGYLVRRKSGSLYEYSPRIEQQDLLKGLVSDFVERSLGGSLTPFVAYLADTGKLSAKELADLKRMVETLEKEEGGAK
jgi:predicted transcriptional regulator